MQNLFMETMRAMTENDFDEYKCPKCSSATVDRLILRTNYLAEDYLANCGEHGKAEFKVIVSRCNGCHDLLDYDSYPIDQLPGEEFKGTISLDDVKKALL